MRVVLATGPDHRYALKLRSLLVQPWEFHVPISGPYAISKRVQNLEKESGAASGKQQLLLIVCKAGCGLALDQDTCLRILGEAGFLPTGRMGIVDLGGIPEGLDAVELERFLRENGARLA